MEPFSMRSAMYTILGTTGGAIALGLASAWMTLPAQAADPSANSAPRPAQSAYDREVARCNSGTSGQDKATCLREAGAARQESGRGRLNEPAYETNATRRCDSLPAGQRQDCVTQMNAPTSTQGSVQGGGVMRETVIPVPAATPGTPATPVPAPAVPVPAAPAPVR